jgi:hypothetical protein
MCAIDVALCVGGLPLGLMSDDRVEGKKKFVQTMGCRCLIVMQKILEAYKLISILSQMTFVYTRLKMSSLEGLPVI